MVTLYGLKSCDTCRKALRELENAGFSVVFRDIREDPLDDGLRQRFLAAFGDSLLNRRSTTWRSLPDAERRASPGQLLAEHPTLMKRPVIDSGGVLTLGWDEAAKATHLET